MNQVKQIQTVDFHQEVIDSSRPVIIDFFAPWCGPCRLVGPVLEKLALAYAKQVKVVKIDTDTSPDLARQFQISGVPTLISFANGREQDRLVGLLPPAELREWFERQTRVTV